MLSGYKSKNRTTSIPIPIEQQQRMNECSIYPYTIPMAVSLLRNEPHYEERGEEEDDEERLDELFGRGGGVLWWQEGLSYVPSILFICVMMRPPPVFLLGGPVHHRFIFVRGGTQRNRRCRSSMLQLKMVGHAIEPSCISHNTQCMGRLVHGLRAQVRIIAP